MCLVTGLFCLMIGLFWRRRRERENDDAAIDAVIDAVTDAVTDASAPDGQTHSNTNLELHSIKE